MLDLLQYLLYMLALQGACCLEEALECCHMLANVTSLKHIIAERDLCHLFQLYIIWGVIDIAACAVLCQPLQRLCHHAALLLS